MKIVGVIVYIGGILGLIYCVMENIISASSFGGIVVIFLWLAATMGIGTALMNSDNNNSNNGNDGGRQI